MTTQATTPTPVFVPETKPEPIPNLPPDPSIPSTDNPQEVAG